MRGVLIESLVLSLAGTMLGVIVGAGGVRVLKAWLPAGIPRVAAIAIDWRVLLVAAGAALVTGLMFGLLPAWHSSRPNISQGLRDGGRSVTAGARQRGRGRRNVRCNCQTRRPATYTDKTPKATRVQGMRAGGWDATGVAWPSGAKRPITSGAIR